MIDLCSQDFVAVALVLFGIGMTAWAFIECRHAHASPAWPTTEGVITRSQLMRYARRHRWDWHVGYRYGVGGQQHHGWRAYFGSSVPMRVARNIVARFPVGSTVAVYYHPQQPARSVLIPGANKYTYLGFLIGPFCWVMAAVFWTLGPH